MKEAPVLAAATALDATAVAATTVAEVTAAAEVVVVQTVADAAGTGFGEFINGLEVVMMVWHGFCETIVVMVVVVVTTAPGRTAMAVLAIVVVVVMPICELSLLLCVASAERIIIVTEKMTMKRQI